MINTAAGTNRLIDQAKTEASCVPNAERRSTSRAQDAQHFAHCLGGIWQVHKAVAAEHSVEASLWERKGLRVALLKTACGNQLSGEFNRSNGKIKPDNLSATLQCGHRQHGGTTTYIQYPHAVRHARRVQHGRYRLTCHRTEG